jgi:uncharacterized phage infection (PIP) family protein YhgE
MSPRIELSDPQGLQRWREDAERRDQEFARERRLQEMNEERAQRRAAANEAAVLRTAFEQRLTKLEAGLQELQISFVDVMRAINNALNDLANQRMDLSAEQRDEIRQLKQEVAKLGSTFNALRDERANFKFAREKDNAAVELPDFLSSRRNN